MSCTNNDAVNAYVFVNVMLFTKGNTIFPDILRHDKCYSATDFLNKSFIMGNGLIYHSIDCREYKGLMIFCAGNLTHELIVFKFSYLIN